MSNEARQFLIRTGVTAAIFCFRGVFHFEWSILNVIAGFSCAIILPCWINLALRRINSRATRWLSRLLWIPIVFSWLILAMTAVMLAVGFGREKRIHEVPWRESTVRVYHYDQGALGESFAVFQERRVVPGLVLSRGLAGCHRRPDVVITPTGVLLPDCSDQHLPNGEISLRPWVHF